MKRLLMLIVAMVLLSGAAWGEYASVKELRAAWFLNDCESGTSTFRILNIPDPKNPNCTFETSGVTTFGSVPDGWTPFMEMNYFLVIGRRVCKFGAPDPTAWKLTDSKYGVEPWADSRYRLERNEVTGECRIQFRSEKYGWIPVNYWPSGSIWEATPSCDELEKLLGEYRNGEPEDRRREKIDKAWRPIK